MDDAYAADCKAMLAMFHFAADSENERKWTGRGFWDNVPMDARMEHGRKLAVLGADFLDDIKQLLIAGHVSAHVADGEAAIAVRDPRFIDFDEPQLPKAEFIDIMMNVPVDLDDLKSCSGEQNHG